MNVAYILHSTVRTGGATKSFMEMLQMLMQKGVSPYIVLPDKEGIYKDLDAMGIPLMVATSRPNAYPDVHSIKDALLFLPRLAARLMVNRRAAQKTASYLSDKAIDLVHSNVSVTKIGYLAAKKLRVPHVFHIREYVDKDFGYHYFPTKRRLRDILHAPHSYSICITKDIQAYHGLKGSNSSRVIYNGIKPHAASVPSCEKEDFILFAGRIQPAKGVDQLLEGYLAYMNSVPSPLPLKIAGGISDADYYRELTRFIQANGMAAHVTFMGDVRDIDSLMQSARAIVIASLFEGFGRCMAEAMFNGCLVIGRNTGGTKEQLDNGVGQEGTEIGLRYETADQLAQQLTAITGHYDQFCPYIGRAFRTVNNLYTSENNAQQVYQFYKDILHAPARGASAAS